MALSAQVPGDSAGLKPRAQLLDSTRLRGPIELSPVVVTATLAPVAAVTAATTTISGAELRARGITYVLDALRAVPGATVVQNGSFGGAASLFLRGGESDFTRFLLDGVPLNDPGGAFNLADLTTEDVDRIEIVRGPTSVLYGTDAVSGVVQIFTRHGTGRQRLTAAARGGTYGTVSVDAGVSGGNAGGGYAFEVTQNRTDGIYAFNNAYRQTGLTAHAHLAPDAASDVHLTLRYTDHAAHIPTDGAGALVDHNAFQYGDGLAVGLTVERFFTPRLEGKLLVASHTTDGGFDDAQDDAADTLGFYASNSIDHVLRQSVDGHANLSLTSDVVLTAGGTLERERDRSLGESESAFGPSSSALDIRRLNGAGYAQLAGNFRGLALNAGVRLDQNDAFGRFFTYRAGAAYAFPTATRLRGAVGTAFREPTFTENFAQGFARGNPDLAPENSRSWELGLEQQLFAGRVTVSATWFHQRFVNLIEYVFAPPTPDGPNFFNVAAARAEGLEAMVAVTPLPSMTASVGYTYVRTGVLTPGFDTTGTGLFAPAAHLLRRPTHQASGGVDVHVASRGSVHAGVEYVGARDDIDYQQFARVRLLQYALINLSGEVLVLGSSEGRAVYLTGRVANLGGVAYQAVSGFPAPGRTVLGGIRSAF